MSGFNWLCAELRNILIGVNGVARCFACCQELLECFGDLDMRTCPQCRCFTDDASFSFSLFGYDVDDAFGFWQ